MNLLSNAIRFTDRGGTVSISARAEAAHIAFTVEDNGAGISDEDLTRVGEPYFQAGNSYDRRHGGTGLGLSIVNGLVHLHGGEIAIRSRLGEGTRVTVRLPIDCERARLAQSADVRQPVGPVSYLPFKGARPSSTAAMRDHLPYPVAPEPRVQELRAHDALVKKSA